MEVDLMALSQPEAQRRLAAGATVLVAAGSVEQHGPHLPLGTDAYAIDAFAREVARRMAALLYPTTPLGITPLHMGFAGTVSLRPETYQALLEDVLESAIRHGARRIGILNWHEVNTPAIEVSALRVQTRYPEARIATSMVAFVARELFGQEVGLTHGGAIECLAVMAYDPGLVHLEKATNPSDWEQSRRRDEQRRRRTARPVISDVRQLYPTGWYGRLEGVTVERAREMLETVADVTARQLEEAFRVLEERPEA